MQVVISDANVIIDIECCGLTIQMLSLPYQFLLPDILFQEELQHHHPGLLDKGFVEMSLNPESLSNSIELGKKYTKPSRYDCLALAAAIQEECPLLTGDKNLRKAAKQEEIEFKGTLWIMEELFISKLISLDQTIQAFEVMKEAGSRLPQGEITKLVERLQLDV